MGLNLTDVLHQSGLDDFTGVIPIAASRGFVLNVIAFVFAFVSLVLTVSIRLHNPSDVEGACSLLIPVFAMVFTFAAMIANLTIESNHRQAAKQVSRTGVVRVYMGPGVSPNLL